MSKKTPNSHDRIRLSIVDTYYDKAQKCSRQKTVESIGWLDELEEQYDDPIAYFSKRVEGLNEQKQKNRLQSILLSMIQTDSVLVMICAKTLAMPH